MFMFSSWMKRQKSGTSSGRYGNTKFLSSQPSLISTIITQVKAVDADQAENGLISYTIKNATEDLPVSINQETGQLSLTSLETNKRK